MIEDDAEKPSVARKTTIERGGQLHGATAGCCQLRPTGPSLRGNRIVKVVPLPSSLSTTMEP